MMLCVSACFGEYAPALGASQGTGTGTGTGTGSTSTTAAASTAGPTESSSSSDVANVCEHVNILILTDVSLSMAPFAEGIIGVLLAMGTQIEDTLADVGTFRLGLAFNAPPLTNENAYSVPEGGGQCTQLGALVRGQSACVEEFGSRPYLTENDDLGAGLTCLAEGIISGGFSAGYERPRILDTLVAMLEAEDDPTLAALAACNEGFQQSPDPLFVIVIADADDESDASVLQAVTRAVATQGNSLKNIGVFIVGADASQCPDDGQNECGAVPACTVQEFLDRGFNNIGLGGNTRRFNICRSLEEDSAPVAEALLDQIAAVLVEVCG